MLRADRTGSSSWAIIYRPDSRRVIERLIALAESGRAICLKDNHEQMGARTAFFGETDLWFGNGGEETLRSQDSRPSPLLGLGAGVQATVGQWASVPNEEFLHRGRGAWIGGEFDPRPKIDHDLGPTFNGMKGACDLAAQEAAAVEICGDLGDRVQDGREPITRHSVRSEYRVRHDRDGAEARIAFRIMEAGEAISDSEGYRSGEKPRRQRADMVVGREPTRPAPESAPPSTGKSLE